MVVEPRLQAVDVHLGAGVAGPSALLRNVGVDPVGRRLSLVDDDRDQLMAIATAARKAGTPSRHRSRAGSAAA